jgi:hypothetical protein
MITDFTELVKSSIDKSVEMKLFKDKKDSAYQHLYNYKLEKIPLSFFKNNKVKNYKGDRLKKRTIETSYPKDNRPKGEYNIKAVEYHMELIDKKLNPLIWMVKKNDNYYLIHGTHKLVAANLKKLKKIDAYVVHVTK